MRIYFIRHGESEANLLREVSNRGLRHGLTPRGRAQARVLAGRLAGAGITRIYSSPVLRAIETSVLLADQLDAPYEVTEALREYDCGELEGRADPQAWERMRDPIDAWLLRGEYGYCLPGGESFDDMRARFVPFVAGLLAGDGRAVACVSHGGLYRMMLPLVVANLDHATVSERGFAYTACLACEVRAGELVCADWDGQPV